MKWIKRIVIAFAVVLVLAITALFLLGLRSDGNRILAEVTIRQSPQAIWPWLYEPDKLKSWVRGLVDVKAAPGEPVSGGHSVWVMSDQNNRGALMEIASRVEAVEPARRMALQLNSPGAFQGGAVYRLTDLGNGATRVEMDGRYHFDNWFAQFMMPVVASVARNKAASDLDRLRKLVEAR